MKKIFLVAAALLLASMAWGVKNSDRVLCYLIKHGPAKIEKNLAETYMPEKFWLHRVNSVAKQKEFAHKYSGLEFDIIYYEQERAFENSHDKTSLSKFNLEEQFREYKRGDAKNKLWLDFKNLRNSNKHQALATLNTLIEKYDVDRKKLIVESGHPEALDVFKEAGYFTSYYFPYYKWKEMTPAQIKEARAKTERIARSGNVDAISFYGAYYDFVSKLQVPPRIAFLSWLNGQSWYEVRFKKQYGRIYQDPRVKVILVKDLGKHTR